MTKVQQSSSDQPVYLVDASIYIFQAHFSPHLTAEDTGGEDQSAFMGFARFLLRFMRVSRARHLAVAFDESLFCGFRHQLYPDYKSNRELPDENLERQLAACSALCRVLGIPAYASEVYEADDIIGTIARNVRSETPERAINIVSRDKDLAQLLRGDNDQLWDFHRDLLRNRQAVIEQYGITPEQIPCFLGLTGDSVDCIPGVPGIGPVAARVLLQHFGAMPDMYERLDEVAGLSFRGSRKAMEKLVEHQSVAELSRRLATIVEDPPLKDEAFSRAGVGQLALQEAEDGEWQSLMTQERVSEGERRRLQVMLDAWRAIHT